MEPTSPLYMNSETPKTVFSTKFIEAPKRLNDESLCVNTVYHQPTSSGNNLHSKIKIVLKNTLNYTIFFYTLWGTFQFIYGGLFSWYMHIAFLVLVLVC